MKLKGFEKNSDKMKEIL